MRYYLGLKGCVILLASIVLCLSGCSWSPGQHPETDRAITPLPRLAPSPAPTNTIPAAADTTQVPAPVPVAPPTPAAADLAAERAKLLETDHSFARLCETKGAANAF